MSERVAWPKRLLSAHGLALAEALGQFQCVECFDIEPIATGLARQPYGPGPICVGCATGVHGMKKQEDGSYE